MVLTFYDRSNALSNGMVDPCSCRKVDLDVAYLNLINNEWQSVNTFTYSLRAERH